MSVIYNKKIFIGITNNKRLDIDEKEKELLSCLKVSSPNNKKLIESDSLVFDFHGDKNDYENVKQIIVIFLFLKGVQFVYFPDLDDIKDIRQLSRHSIEHQDKTIKKMEISKEEEKEEENNLNITSNVLSFSYAITSSVKVDIKKVIAKIQDFETFYKKIEFKSADKYIHLIELYNYLAISVSTKIKYINLFIILEALANYYNDDYLDSKADKEKKAELLKKYGDYNNNRNNKIFNNNPKDQMKNLYKIRNKIVHDGTLDEEIKNESEHLKKHSIDELTFELTKYTKNSLKYDLLSYLDIKE